MTTIYTVNNKVLKNSANDKWLIKKAGPAGFVMNASNVTSSTSTYASWESPGYPDGWDGGGKTLELTVTQDITLTGSLSIVYSDNVNTNGPLIVQPQQVAGTLTAGKYTYIMSANPAPTADGYGKYIVVYAARDSVSTWLPYISMTILD
jgi:hypothetical protein